MDTIDVMAHKLVLVDDLDGSELGSNSATTRFSLDGTQYEIDLGAANKQKLAEALRPFISSARKTAKATSAPSANRSRSQRSGSGPTRSSETAAIRAWAHDNGYDVGVRGRISADVREAYLASRAQS